MASITEILNTAQQGVQAVNGLVKQMTGTLNNIAGQLSSINTQLASFEDAWTPYTPVIGVFAGSIVATSTGRFNQIGKTTFVQIAITFSSGANGGSAISATLPVPSVSGFGYIIPGRELNWSGKMLQGYTPASSYVLIFNYDNTYPSSNNTSFLTLTGVYEAA
jgi:hypothetical protein